MGHYVQSGIIDPVYEAYLAVDPNNDPFSLFCSITVSEPVPEPGPEPVPGPVINAVMAKVPRFSENSGLLLVP